MKTGALILTLLITFCTLGHGQVPDANYDIWISVDQYIGKRVGTGLCGEMVDSVLINTNLGVPDSGRAGYYHYTLEKDETVYPGDIISFKGAVIGSRKYPDHIAIVYAIKKPNAYYIVHQNVDVDSLKDSRVVVTLLKMKKKKKGSVEFHRVLNI
tara:strand:+ start:496 stop:960 length:465 start_codon:yes stop_codon:yes gene_type:complete